MDDDLSSATKPRGLARCAPRLHRSRGSLEAVRAGHGSTRLPAPDEQSSQAEGEYFFEQRRLAVRRLQTGKQRGFFDGLYMIGNAPVVLCEIKRPDAVASAAELNRALRQLERYAASDDFATPPPFLLLYSGDPGRSRFLRRRPMADSTLLDYEDLGEIWDWRRVKDAHDKGAFEEEVVSRERLLEILLHHLDSIEDDVRSPVAQAVHFVSGAGRDGLLPPFARWLDTNPEAARRMRELYERKVAEVPGGGQAQVIEEMVTQAALNYVNKVFLPQRLRGPQPSRLLSHHARVPALEPSGDDSDGGDGLPRPAAQAHPRPQRRVEGRGGTGLPPAARRSGARDRRARDRAEQLVRADPESPSTSPRTSSRSYTAPMPTTTSDPPRRPSPSSSTTSRQRAFGR